MATQVFQFTRYQGIERFQHQCAADKPHICWGRATGHVHGTPTCNPAAVTPKTTTV
jgi:hypothetical protein